MTTHLTYVQTMMDGSGHFASCCTCGCDPFPDRDTFEEAEADARSHGEYGELTYTSEVPWMHNGVSTSTGRSQQ